MVKERVVEVLNKSKKFKIDKEAIVNYTLNLMDELKIEGEITIIFLGKKKIREINREYRNKDKETDVISFFYESPLNRVFGDILICLDVAYENAQKYNVDFVSEIKKLLVHSILHILGYDHHIDDGKMRRKERKILKKLEMRLC